MRANELRGESMRQGRRVERVWFEQRWKMRYCRRKKRKEGSAYIGRPATRRCRGWCRTLLTAGVHALRTAHCCTVQHYRQRTASMDSTDGSEHALPVRLGDKESESAAVSHRVSSDVLLHAVHRSAGCSFWHFAALERAPTQIKVVWAWLKGTDHCPESCCCPAADAQVAPTRCLLAINGDQDSAQSPDYLQYRHIYCDCCWH
jgi:hypothetical protein